MWSSLSDLYGVSKDSPVYSRHSSDIQKWQLLPWDPITDPVEDTSIPERYRKPPTIPFAYPRHLDNALETTKLQFYFEHDQARQRTFPGLPKSAFRPWINGIVNETPVLQWMYQRLISHHQTSDWFRSAPSKRLLRITRRAFELQLSALPDRLPRSRLGTPKSRFDVLEQSNEFSQACHKKRLVLVLHRQLSLGGQCFHGCFQSPDFPGWKFYRELVIITDFPGGALAVPFEHVLSILDKIESEFSLSAYLWSARVSWDKEGTSFCELTTSIYHKLESAYSRFGNQAVDLYKALGTLGLGAVLFHDDEALADTSFLSRTLHDIRQDAPCLYPTALDISGMMLDYILEFGDRGVHHVLEQYGQEKKHYYPLVDTQGGLVKMYRVGTAHRFVDHSAVDEAIGMANVLYFHSYRMHEGSLPPAYLHRGLDPHILNVYRSGRAPTLDECLKIPLVSWARLKWRPHQQFNYIESELELLDDKSVSPRTSKVYQCYHEDAVMALGKRRPTVPDETRLVMTLLKTESVQVKEYYKQVESTGEIPYEWRLAQLKAKERELKRDPRAFTILHPNVRFMASVAERNIRDIVFRYFTQQSMTLSGVELKEKIDDLTRHLGPDNRSWVAMVLDLFQWNYTFRPALQIPFAMIFDDMFGIHHFSANQCIFRDAILVSADSYAPPGIDSKLGGWTHHSGGNQGIFQAFWTFITLILIKKCMLEMDLDHKMTGAGDNQVILYDTAFHTDPKSLTAQVVHKLDREFKRVGLELKPDETWYSPRLFNYHRRYYYKGAPVGIALKQITRAFAEGSDGSTGIYNVITTAMNTGVAVSSATCDPLIGPIMAYLEAYINLLEDPRWDRCLRLTDDQMALLSVGCSEGGNLPFLQLHGFYYSGHGDNLTTSLSLLRIIWDKYPELRSSIIPMCRFEFGDYSKELILSLALDPFTLPKVSLGSPEAFIRGEIERYLKTSKDIKNKQLIEFLKMLDPEVRLLLAEHLGQIRPINTTLLHTLMQNSIIGQCYAALNRFTKLSTLARHAEYDRIHRHEIYEDKADAGTFAQRIESISRLLLQRISKRLQNQGSTATDFFAGVLKSSYHNTNGQAQSLYPGHAPTSYLSFCAKHQLETNCTLSLRQYMTSASLGCLPDIVQGPYIPSPFEQIEYCGQFPSLDKSKCLMVMTVLRETETELDFHVSRGPFAPYRGSSTSDSVAGLSLVPLKNLSAGDNIRTLLRLRQWLTELDSQQDISDLIDSCLSARAPTLIQELIEAQPKRSGGCFTHRYHSAVEDKGSYLITASNVSSHIRVSSNYMTFLNDEGEDYNVFFQVLHTHILYVASLSTPPTAQYAVRLVDRCCTKKIVDPCFSMDQCSRLPPLPVPTTFAVSEDQERELRDSLDHIRSFKLSDEISVGRPDELIASYLAYQVALQWSYSEGGVDSSNSRQSTSLRFIVDFNTSLIRMLPLPLMLAHIGAALALQGALSCGQRISKLILDLKQVTASDVTMVNAHPFKRFLATLTEAGRASELMAYGGGVAKYYLRDVHFLLIASLLRGIARALIDHQLQDKHLFMLLVLRNSRGSLSRAHRFFQINSLHYRELMRSVPDKTPRYYLQMSQTSKHVLCPVLTPDAEHFLALARSQGDKSWQRDYSHSVPPYTAVPVFKSNLTAVSDPWSPIQSRSVSEDSGPPRYVSTAIGLSTHGSPITGSRYKFWEAMCLSTLKPEMTRLAVCLADGAGGVSGLLLHACPNSTIVFNTMLSPVELASGLIGNYTPPGVMCPHDQSHRVRCVSVESEYYGDLAQSQTWDALGETIAREALDIDILTWDLESTSAVDPRVWSSLSDFLARYRPRIALIKLYLGERQMHPNGLMETLCSMYSRHVLIKPTFSQYLSTEVILLCEQPNPSPFPVSPQFILAMEAYLNARSKDPFPLDLGEMLLEHLDWRAEYAFCPDTSQELTLSGQLRRRTPYDYLLWVLSIWVQATGHIVRTDTQMAIGQQHMLFGNTHGSQSLWTLVDQLMTCLTIALSVAEDLIESEPSLGDPIRSTSQAGKMLLLLKWIDEIKVGPLQEHISKHHLGRFLVDVMQGLPKSTLILLKMVIDTHREVGIAHNRTTFWKLPQVRFTQRVLARDLTPTERAWGGLPHLAEVSLLLELAAWLANSWVKSGLAVQAVGDLDNQVVRSVLAQEVQLDPTGPPLLVAHGTKRVRVSLSDAKELYLIILNDRGLGCAGGRVRELKRLKVSTRDRTTIVSLFQIKRDKAQEAHSDPGARERPYSSLLGDV